MKPCAYEIDKGWPLGLTAPLYKWGSGGSQREDCVPEGARLKVAKSGFELRLRGSQSR